MSSPSSTIATFTPFPKMPSAHTPVTFTEFSSITALMMCHWRGKSGSAIAKRRAISEMSFGTGVTVVGICGSAAGERGV